MKQFVLQHMLTECQRSGRVKNCRLETPTADLHIDLDNGKTLAVYVINRAIRVPEIMERYEHNTKKNIYTLFVIDGRMMPADHAEVEPPHWLSALHQVGNGRVYGYWLNGRKVTIRPVHMDWKWGNNPRSVAYGPEIEVSKLRGEVNYTSGKFLNGYYATADFGEGTFWKKHQPADDQTFSYSWRQWSYASQKRTQEQANQQEPWESWEDFEQQYADAEDEASQYNGVGGEDQDFWRSTSRRKRDRSYSDNEQTQQRTNEQKRRVRVVPKINPYTVLGVNANASDTQIKQAYRQKARECHPDLHPEEKEKYTSLMADINAAFELLRKRPRLETN